VKNTTYTRRERVLKTFNHKEPDRIPLDLMGHASMLVDKTYLRLRDYLGLSAIPPVRSGTTANYYDERILEYLDIDFRRIFLKKKRQSPAGENGTYTDEWGITYKKEGLYYNVASHPMKNFRTKEEVEHYEWPKAEDVFVTEGLKEQAKHLYEKTGYALVARNPLTAGFLDRGFMLFGMAEFLMAIMTSPELARCAIRRMLEIYNDVYSMFLDEIGPYVQMVETGDDMGTQESTLVSPAIYRELFKPAESELYALIRKKAPDAKIFRHCDGAIFDLIPDFIEIGVDILNPVQTSARNMEPHKLKETFGDRLVFHGTLESVGKGMDAAITELKERVAVFAPNGGYVLSTCNHLIDVEPEDIVAIFQAAKEYGMYSKNQEDAS